VIDLRNEEILSLQQAADLARVSFPSIWRWALRGLPGPMGKKIRLRAARLGARWITSVEALHEFQEACSPDLDTATIPLRTRSAKRIASAKATETLQRIGI
jgi:hypothetical protein